MIEAYLSSQLQTFVAIVISVVHLVIPLSQDHPPHHHSQVNTLGPKVKLFNLKTNYNFLETIKESLHWVYSNTLVSRFTYRHVCEDKWRQQFSGLLHLGLFGSPPHALPPNFIPKIPQSLRHRAAHKAELRSFFIHLFGEYKHFTSAFFIQQNMQKNLMYQWWIELCLKGEVHQHKYHYYHYLSQLLNLWKQLYQVLCGRGENCPKSSSDYKFDTVKYIATTTILNEVKEQTTTCRYLDFYKSAEVCYTALDNSSVRNK